ncbi:hypothetical protein NST17_20060 [Caldifermentibacillus hisashii]|uniref:DNA methyltransferase n=1 Tax=Caldifermentibacillus hisashii TaxID=996558 RepID=A0ABU9K4H0_9BACI
MSSTLRGYERHKSDYYVTPIDRIELFIDEFIKYEPNAFSGGWILDPTAGGDAKHPMSYPTAIKNKLNKNTYTIDIREDSLADIKGDFLKLKLDFKPVVIITNPPFNISREIIEKSLDIVKDNGFVIMLLRLNYFGGKTRRDMWDKQMPKYCFVHNRRMSFTEDNKTDSVEYAHFVWQKRHKPEFTMLKVID